MTMAGAPDYMDKTPSMLFDPSGRLLPGIGALRLFSHGEADIGPEWSTMDQPPYLSPACGLLQPLDGGCSIEVDGRWWTLRPGHLGIIPARRRLRRRCTRMRHRWAVWGCATVADDLRLGSHNGAILLDAAAYSSWCEALIPVRNQDRRSCVALTGVLLQASALLLGSSSAPTVDQAPESTADPLIDAAVAHLDRLFPRGASVPAWARAVGCSPSHLHARFKAVLGMTPAGYLRERQLHHARYLLAGTDLPIADIARRCGYDDPLHFSRVVRRACGQSPTALRQRMRAS
jgi:AraC-like DNA-binding protein